MSNKETILVSTPFMTQVNVLGQGFDIYDGVGIKNVINPLLSAEKSTNQVFNFLGKDYILPSYAIGVENTSGYYTSGTSHTRSELQDKFAADMGVEGSYGAFSGKMSAAYSQKFASSSEYSYSYRNFYAQLATLSLNNSKDYLKDSFTKRIKELPSTVEANNIQQFFNFFNDYGIYYVNRITLGGSLEYYVSIEKSKMLSETEISACLEAEYNAVVASGKVEASMEASAMFKKFKEGSHISATVHGGDPSKIGEFSKLATTPSEASVQAYSDWLGSIKEDPAIVDFELEGIWKLCGEKERTVHEAFVNFGHMNHPKITIKTASYGSVKNKSGAPKVRRFPLIYLNGLQIVPTNELTGPSGFQLVILDNNQINISKENILLNKFYSFKAGAYGDWQKTYEDMYDQMSSDLNEKDLKGHKNIVIITSYNIDRNMFPTPEIVRFLRESGADVSLQKWEDSCNPGSQMNLINNFRPVCYSLVGISGKGLGSGIEQYDFLDKRFEWDDPDRTVTSELEVYLFKQNIRNGEYTIGT